ncbi:cyclodeaminase/cyclohydrolase family protein [uncultured Porphyromonas sp.]|uniref:cyclodeaminase/cyclohydrolase family protein n=1 Tax=uncultured Porphyromonas sp. TaxID=159274 RepID=UPI0025E3213E|nr:cyclodeaminase/cyclohydrolase family protein [uncultured Porphyromonas sp.]
MKLIDMTVAGFIDELASDSPAPGGGSVSALNGAIAAALTSMVGNLTIGKKKYADVEEEMREIVSRVSEIQKELLEAVDKDSDAFNVVFAAFKWPKETEEEKEARSAEIQRGTKIAADVPMRVAEKAAELMPLIEKVIMKGNQNSITDACCAMMACRYAVIGALLNVRINLGSIKDETFVKEHADRAAELEKKVNETEQKILSHVYQNL